MNLLITALEFASFRNISAKLDTAKIEEAISLAQQSDLLKILGDFYFDVLKNATEESFKDLLDGSEFTVAGLDYKHAGIKRLLADFTFARYIQTINVNLTPFGAVSKLSQDSEGTDRNTIKDLSKQAQIDAGIKFEFIDKYIVSNPVAFARYCKNKKTGTSFSSLRISRL